MGSRSAAVDFTIGEIALLKRPCSPVRSIWKLCSQSSTGLLCGNVEAGAAWVAVVYNSKMVSSDRRMNLIVEF